MSTEAAGVAVKTTLVLADDHPAMLAGARLQLLEDESLRIAGEATDGVEALRLNEQHRPDNAIVDVRMPRMGGLELLEKVGTDGLGTRVILLSAATDTHLVQRALDLGAAGYVSKVSPLRQIHQAVRAVAGGARYIDPTLLGQLLQADGSRLSPREHDVLQLAANGLQNKEIATSLSVSAETVKSHLSSAMRKLQAHSRTQAVAAALRQSFIE